MFKSCLHTLNRKIEESFLILQNLSADFSHYLWLIYSLCYVDILRRVGYMYCLCHCCSVNYHYINMRLTFLRQMLSCCPVIRVRITERKTFSSRCVRAWNWINILLLLQKTRQVYVIHTSLQKTWCNYPNNTIGNGGYFLALPGFFYIMAK